MISFTSSRALPPVSKAFHSDEEFIAKTIDLFYQLADIFSTKYEMPDKDLIIDVKGDSLDIYIPDNSGICVTRQTATRQVWVASPISGSLKFEYDSENNCWFATKDFQLEIVKSLDNEVTRILSADEKIQFEF